MTGSETTNQILILCRGSLRTMFDCKCLILLHSVVTESSTRFTFLRLCRCFKRALSRFTRIFQPGEQIMSFRLSLLGGVNCIHFYKHRIHQQQCYLMLRMNSLCSNSQIVSTHNSQLPTLIQFQQEQITLNDIYRYIYV